MSILTTGKRFYNVNKNIESRVFNSHSTRYFHSRNISDLPVVPKNETQEPDATQLKQTLESQNERINQLQALLEKPVHSNMRHSESEIINSAIVRPELASQVYKNHLLDLDKQLEEKNRQRILNAISKEKELKMRLKQLNTFRQNQIQEKVSYLKKAQEYKNHLDVQQSFKDQIDEKEIIESEFYSPLAHFRKERSGYNRSMDLLKSVPELSREEIFPKTKNLNRLAVEYSAIPAFQQPRYTKYNPKVVPSFPVIGSKTKHKEYENF